ncbi:MAG: glycosyltransferase family A protein [Pseudomonadota bacterium]
MADTMPASEPTLKTAIPVGLTDHGEDVLSNGVSGEAALSICVPAFRDTADALLASLVRLAGADQCTLLIFDDGSCDEEVTRQLARQILRFPGPARLITAPQNAGRSHARNRLLALAETDWILFLDADMRPDEDDFLTRYLEALDEATEPTLIPGGFTLKHAHPTEETLLHASQSRTSECVTAEVRGQEPGRYVFTSNILVHRAILDAVQFDDGFTGWGWEDVDWGLRIADEFPIDHIDNTATHLGLDTDAALMAKYAGSGANFARAIERHPEALKSTPLYKAAYRLARMPGRSVLKSIAGFVAQRRWLPTKLRLFALKLYRAAVYAKAL